MTKTKKQSLPFQRANAFLADPDDLYVEERPGHRHYDARVHLPPDEHHVKTMMEDGVHLPVAVEKCGDLSVVVDGRRRVVNAREACRRLEKAGLPRIKVLVIPKRGDEGKLAKLSLVTNAHRLAETPVSEAHKIADYMARGYTEQDAADLLGYDVQTVKKRLKLLELCPEAQAAVAAGQITMSKGVSLAKKNYEEQKKALKEKKAPRKTYTKKPSRAKFDAVLGSNGGSTKTVAAARAAILWSRGELSDDEAAKAIPGFAAVLKGAE